MGINYKEIESNSVGNKIDYNMYSMDFEGFLWAKEYTEEQIDDLYKCMIELRPLGNVQYEKMMQNFKEYMVIGGMPAIVSKFIYQKNYSGTLDMQRQILLNYEEDITKYANGLDQGKILNVYRKIPICLGNENKKFQISKVEDRARKREYIETIEWLDNAGIVNVSYCMEQPELPLGGNYNPNNFRLYFSDTGVLIGSLDEEAQEDIRNNKNFNTYKGAIYENIVRDKNSLIPVEVKANDNSTTSLNKLIDDKKYKDIKYGIKLCNKNIGFNGKFYTFPYFLTFLLKNS
ncbi:putative uncharacterized protein [Clostridium sp. CAG:1219]|nr:putative uncharacterized protein [Clostridium sp. CAG:1219]